MSGPAKNKCDRAHPVHKGVVCNRLAGHEGSHLGGKPGGGARHVWKDNAYRKEVWARRSEKRKAGPNDSSK